MCLCTQFRSANQLIHWYFRIFPSASLLLHYFCGCCFSFSLPIHFYLYSILFYFFGWLDKRKQKPYEEYFWESLYRDDNNKNYIAQMLNTSWIILTGFRFVFSPPHHTIPLSCLAHFFDCVCFFFVFCSRVSSVEVTTLQITYADTQSLAHTPMSVQCGVCMCVCVSDVWVSESCIPKMVYDYFIICIKFFCFVSYRIFSNGTAHWMHTRTRTTLANAMN